MSRHILSFSFALAVGIMLLGGVPQSSWAQGLDDTRIWRLQLRVHTADQKNAGTDAKVWVQLNHEGNGRSGTRFWLDRSGDDRKRGRMDTYDIPVLSLRNDFQQPTIRDLQLVKFGIRGKDAWGFDRIELLVNNDGTNDAASRLLSFGTRSTQWIRGNTTSEVDALTTRQMMLIKSAQRRSGLRLPGPPRFISRGVLESMVEGLMGHLMGPDQLAEELRWGKGSRKVKLKRQKRSPAHVAKIDLDLAAEGGSRRFRKVDVDFNLRAHANGTRAVLLNLANLKIDPGFLGDVAIKLGIKDKPKNAFPDQLYSLLTGDAGLPIFGFETDFDVRPRYDSHGNLIIAR